MSHTKITGPVMTYQVEWGHLRVPMRGKRLVVGDRLVPPLIEVEFPGVDGQPSLRMLVEVIDGVPRCTEVTLRRTDAGREIRPRDLRAIDLDSWIESFVSLVSGQITGQKDGVIAATVNVSEQAVTDGMKVIRDVRKGSRRPMTGQRLQRVADVYNARESGGIDAVRAAFGVSRATAVRYIKTARDAGLIQERD